MSPDEFEKWSRFRGRGIFRFVLVLGGMVGGAWAAWMFPVVVLCRVLRDHPIRWIATAFNTASFGLIFGLVTSVGLWVQLEVRYRFTAARQREGNRDASTLVLLPRRSGGRLFSLASAISLLLCAATVSLWIFTYYRGIGWRVVRDFHPDADLVQVRCAGLAFRGGFCVNVTHNHATTVQSTNDLLEDHRWSPPFKVWTDSADELDTMNDHLLPRRTYRFKSASPSPFGFQFGTRQGVYRGNEFWTATAAIPFWFPFTLLALLPLLWAWVRQRRHRRARRGYCSSCGYDLRASTDRCPECGTPIPAEAKG